MIFIAVGICAALGFVAGFIVARRGYLDQVIDLDKYGLWGRLMTIELKQGLILKSNDGEYVYNIYLFNPESETMVLDILDKNLNTVATKNQYSVALFRQQIESGTIVAFKDDEIIGAPNEQAEWTTARCFSWNIRET